MAPKHIHKNSTPKKLFSFLNTPKNIEIQNFESKKKYVPEGIYEISEYPPGLAHPKMVKTHITLVFFFKVF